MSAQNTPGPWYWHTDYQGRVSLRTPDRGQLIVMQFVRQGMQGAAPRFSHWAGYAEGNPRGRSGGVMDIGIDHPDARLIAAAPDLLVALQAMVERYCDDESLDSPIDEVARAAIAKAQGETA